jgi:nitroimidazol reductase NimA-like FMN-containing flavoprotein (pyridoxamine 5'-phosphate oxidase superfamily)
MTEFQTTSRNKVRQVGDRGRYDRETVYRIVDEAPVCHVGFAEEGQPYVIPTLHAREGDALLLHGAPGSRLIRHVQAGHPVCVSFALFDGWVLGKAACSHSMNYRSVVIFGQGRLVESPKAKMNAFERFTERMMPGRWAEVRPPNKKELRQTAIVAIEIEEASAKVRGGSARDSRADQELDVWAGVVPVRMAAGTPAAAEYVQEDVPPSGSVRAYVQREQDLQH